MKYIRDNELTLANTVPQLVACRTSDLQLAYKWTHSVRTVLAGPTTVSVGRTLVHICRGRTRVTVCEMTGRRGTRTEGAWLWGGGKADSLIVTMTELNESAAHERRQEKYRRKQHFSFNSFLHGGFSGIPGNDMFCSCLCGNHWLGSCHDSLRLRRSLWSSTEITFLCAVKIMWKCFFQIGCTCFFYF